MICASPPHQQIRSQLAALLLLLLLCVAVPAALQHLLPEQCLLDEPEHYNAMLKYIPDEELRSSLAAKWAKGERLWGKDCWGKDCCKA
jgi:hypothetical protein